VITEVAKSGAGARALEKHSLMLFLRHASLSNRVLRADGEAMRLYEGSSQASLHRGLWHKVWCAALQVAHMLTVKLAAREQHTQQLLAFVITYYERIRRVLSSVVGASWQDARGAAAAAPPGRGAGATGLPALPRGVLRGGLAGGWGAQDPSLFATSAEVEAGLLPTLSLLPSLALLEEVRLPPPPLPPVLSGHASSLLPY
jgi:hypothetical protein